MCACKSERESSVLPVAPAALGQSDMCDLGNEQKSIPLKQRAAVGHIDVPWAVGSHHFPPLRLPLCNQRSDRRACPRL